MSEEDPIVVPDYVIAPASDSENADDLFVWEVHAESAYRVIAGPFVSKDTAKRWMRKLRHDNPQMKPPTP